MSVLAGDWLYMQSFEMALSERNFAILDILIDLTQNMVEGELLQLTRARPHRLHRSGCHRARLPQDGVPLQRMRAAGRGARAAAEAREEALAEYGRNAGLAFQLIDDLLDFTASLEKLGKPVLSDLKEGKVTLPLIFALQSGAPPSGNAERVFGVRRPAAGGESSGRARIPERAVRTKLRSWCSETGALDRAANLARDYVNRAKACLERTPRHRISPRAARGP